MTRPSVEAAKANGDAATADDLRAISAALVTITRRGSSQARHRARLEEAGVQLSFPGAHVLNECCRCGPTRVSDLAEATEMPVPMVSREANRLIADGHLRRRSDPDDGRITILEATALGRQALERYQRLADRKLEAALADWPAKDVRQFAALLERFTDAGARS